MKLAKEYQSTLGWETILFDPLNDKCYCAKCYPSTLPDVTQAGGAEYVIPRGWVRLGLHVDTALATTHDVWNKWVVTFHGTTLVAAQSILRHRHFLLPGDKLLDSSVLGIRAGHIPNKKHIYTSPTIAYASLPVYSPSYVFHSESTRRDYQAQVVFQCRQDSNTFEVQAETIGAKETRICKFIPNHEVEYYTEVRSSIVAYGLLVRIE